MGNITNRLFGLENRSIIVAGGAGQIGFSFCVALAQAGAKISILDIDVEMAEKKLNSLNDNVKKQISILKTDVTKPENVASTVNAVVKKMGSLYGLVNAFHFKGNTRILDKNSNFFASFENYPLNAWDMVHDVNLRGTFIMTQACIPYMKKSKGGVIVNISSTYGLVSANKYIYGNSGINSPVAYATSKAAIINFTRYISTHLADDNIRANTLSPGGVFNDQSDEFVTNYIEHTPLHRMATADDYQGAIIFLMSDASAYMTGSNLVVDGGWTAW